MESVFENSLQTYQILLLSSQVWSIIINFLMSQFRIQRKFTEGASIRQRQSIINPSRMKSQEIKQSYSRSPKKREHESLKRIVQKIAGRRPSEQSECIKGRLGDGVKAYKQKNVVRATQIFKEIYKNGMKSAELTFYLGSCLLNSGKHQASIMYLNQCISLSPVYNPNAYLYVAVNFKFIGNVKQAIRILEEGLTLFPNFEEGAFYKAKLLMKIGEYDQAIEAFYYCLRINAVNDLGILFLGDCFRAQQKTEKAIEQYNKIIRKNRKYVDLAAIRIASILIEMSEYQKAQEMLVNLQGKGMENPELNYYLGLACCGLDQKQEATIYFQSCLTGTKDMKLVTKAFKNILKIVIQDRDFYQAEHQINRINTFGLPQQKFKEWKLFVQGVGDLIKRKNINGCFKLQRAMEIGESKFKNDKSNRQQYRQFLTYVYCYLGYAFYLIEKLEASIEVYDKALEYNPENIHNLYCRLIVEGILLQSHGKFQTAVLKFQEAFTYGQRPEALFMAAITLVHKYKHHPELQYMLEQKEELFIKVQKCMIKSCESQQKNPLVLFYYSLLLLFMKKPCIEVIQAAIRTCEQPISEYYFVYALALQGEGKSKQALSAITNAIDIDPAILQFYRERSKYHFLAENFNEAIQDCRKAETMEPQDEEIHLLLSFYLYLVDDVDSAYEYLLKMKPSSGKLHQFEQALFLRQGKYQNLEEIGTILASLKELQQIDESVITVIQKCIKERQQFSQFSVYFYHLILAAVYSRRKQYERGIDHLFSCLQEIQLLIDEKDEINKAFDVTWEQTEAMLDEVKFNITVLSLLLANFEETERYINIFAKETTNQDLKQAFEDILKLVKDNQASGVIELFVENEYPKISDQFPTISIPINKKTLITRVLISYPVKLKFTISPQFDPSYLMNFDLQKIDYKVPPPWLKSPQKRLNFTNQICNQSIKLSQSQTSIKQSTKSFHGNIVQHLRLNMSVEAKLDKIMRRL